MRISIIVALLLTATTAAAEPAAIPFREIFAALAEKTQPNADRAFFETEILRGQAAPERDTSVADFEVWSYLYGPEILRGRASYMGTPSGKALFFTAFPSATEANTHCLTLAEAESELLRRNWSFKAEKERGWLGAESIGVIYERNEVTLNVSNEALLLAFAHSPESFKAQQESIEVTVQNRLKITRGNEAYAALCVDVAQVTLPRED